MSEAPRLNAPYETRLSLRWPPTEDDLRRLYLEESLSTRKIAGLYSCSPNKVLSLLRRMGIPTGHRGDFRAYATPALFAEWTRRYQAGESADQIARGVASAPTVLRHLRIQGIGIRPRTIARRLTRMRRDNALFGEDGAEIRRLYLDERLSCARIARRLGFPPEAEGNGAAIVLNRLKELGVKIHARGQLNLRFE